MAQRKDFKTLIGQFFCKVQSISILTIPGQRHLRPSNTDNIFLQIRLRNKCWVAGCDCLVPVLPPPRATKFHVSKSTSGVFFLQHEKFLRTEMVIQPTNNRNVQCNICCVPSCKKILPYLILRLDKLACFRRSDGGGRREENRVV